MLIRNVQLEDLDRCFEIESSAYSGDEAATKEKIKQRIERYPEGFLVFEHAGEVLGFVNGGACFEIDLSDEDFKDLIGHDADGPHVVIMSVAVDPAYQHQGLASQLMRAFIEDMQGMGKQSIYLICQEDLIGFYQTFGFKVLGLSASSHGGLSWHEMSLHL